MTDVDLDWIARQMEREAMLMSSAGEQPRCFWCGALGPGLYWLPSEPGIIEMAVWSCTSCILQNQAAANQRAEAARVGSTWGGGVRRRWKPWTVELVGRESGDRHQVSFLRFWRKERAEEMAAKLNTDRDLIEAKAKRRT